MPFSGNTQNSEKLSEETKTILETVARCSPEWSNDYHTRGSLDASRPLTVVSYREDNEDQLNVMLSKDVPPPVSMKFLTNRGSQTYSEIQDIQLLSIAFENLRSDISNMTVGLQTSLTSETDSVATDTTANLQSKRDAIIQEFNKSENRIRRSFRSRLSDFIAETYESKNLTNIFDCRKLEEQILTNIKERKEKFQLLRQKSRVNKEREVRLREDLARVQIALKKHLLPEISNEGNVYETIDGQKVSQSEALKLYQDRLRKAKLEIKNLEVSTEELQARLDRVVELRRANGNSEGEATNYASLFHSEGNTDFGLVSPEKDEMRADFLRKMAEMQAQLDKDLSREREKTKMELEVSAARFDSLRKKARHSQAAVNLPKTSQLRQKLFDKPTSCMSVGIECNLDSA